MAFRWSLGNHENFALQIADATNFYITEKVRLSVFNSRQQVKNVPGVLANFCFYLGKSPQNRNDIKNGSILRLTTSPVSLISFKNLLISTQDGCTERKLYYPKACFMYYISCSSSSLCTLVPDCSPAPWTDPVVQHGCQTGVSEGPGQRVAGHHLRPGVHQPGRHLPAHSDGGEWHWVSQLSVHLFCCFGFPFLLHPFIPLCVMNLRGKIGNSSSSSSCTDLRSVRTQGVFGVALCILTG